MRFAYADPPYPGQSKRLYGDHPDYGGEVDHAALVARLCADYPDGWALSTSAAALREVLILCPSDVSLAVWHNTNAEPPGGRKVRWHLVWEPVIVWRGRNDGPVIRNLLTAAALAGGCAKRAGRVIPGQKPPAFSRWIFGLLNAQPGDEFDDVFPGSGAVGQEWRTYCESPWLPEVSKPSKRSKHIERIPRQLAKQGVPTLLESVTVRK